MKKSILVSTVILTGLAVYSVPVYSQAKTSTDVNINKSNNETTQGSGVSNQQAYNSNSDGVVMKNGTMMTIMNGKMSKMERDMTMKNGTKVMTDGTIVKKDGTKMMMKEGQQVDMSGNISTMNDSKNMNNGKTNKNMYLVPDSTSRKSR